MKLLFYIPGLVDGGAERVMATLASQFAAKGHEVSLAVDFTVPKAPAFLSCAVRLIPLDKGHGASIRHLSRLLVMERPNIAISAIASCSFKLTAASLLARMKNIASRTKKPLPKIVLTYHGFDEYQTGLLSRLGMVLLPLLSRLTARTIGVSQSLVKELESRWKAKDSRLVCIYNPVSIPRPPDGFSPPQSTNDLQQRENIILSAGRLVPDKRFDLLIRAMANLNSPNARLIILGEGPERAQLNRLIDRLGLSKRIELPGFVEQTGAYYARAKCFVLSSKKESFGLVLVEALAYGLPVISTPRGGPSEILQQGHCGLLLSKDPDEAEIAHALDRFLRSPGDPAPRLMRAQQFDATTGFAHYQKLFEQLLREAD